MTWCMQCGTVGKPEPAIGVDAEGDPACAMHRDRQVQPAKFNASFLEKRMKQFREKPETFDKVEPAAPSPLQATEQEKADMAAERTYSRTCSCGCGAELKGRWPYLKGHNKSDGGALPKKEKAYRLKVPKGGDPLPNPTQLGSGEHLITLQLSESKLARLVALLL
jgi:hypothetical protein